MGLLRPGAHWELSSRSPDEVVRLYDGTIDVAVTPLGSGERFRVVVGASEIEVRGTAFRVVARAGELLSVTVTRGTVEVRPAGGGGAGAGTGTGEFGTGEQ